MQVYKPRCDDQSISINGSFREAGRPSANLSDFPVLNPDISSVARRSHTIDHRTPFYVKIEVSHSWFPPSDSER
jgi:hypothetical protein